MYSRIKKGEKNPIKQRKGKSGIRHYASCILLAALLLSACAEQTAPAYAHVFKVYNINNDDTGIVWREYGTYSDDTLSLVSELLSELALVPDKMEYKAPLSGEFSILSFVISEGQVLIDFSDQYHDLTVISEILTRAALVKTLTQIEGINTVALTVRQEALLDSQGLIIGAMGTDMFIDNVGSELNAYDRTDLRLFFASGEHLSATNRHDVIHNTNVAIEKLIIESLIAGPLEAEANEALLHATINPETRLLSVTNANNVCYVNLDEQFTQLLPGISAEMAVYSLTNSLVELPSISRVRISINGVSGVSFEAINLSNDFERNLDMVQ